RTSTHSAGEWLAEPARSSKARRSMSLSGSRATNGMARSVCRRVSRIFAPPSARLVRIVAGRWRGRTIKPPADQRVRPTADRVREAWMSIVMPDLPGARVLDLFAGSGALGLEALSRGAEV